MVPNSSERAHLLKPSDLRVRRLGVGLERLRTPDADHRKKRAIAEIYGNYSGGEGGSVARQQPQSTTGAFVRNAR